MTLIPAVLLGASAVQAENIGYRHTAEPIGTVREVYDGTLATDIRINTFRNIDRLFPTRLVRRGFKTRELPTNPQSLSDFSVVANGTSHSLDDVLSLNAVTGLLIVRHGQVAYERYLSGNDEHTRWMSMSVVKSVSSALVGAAIQDGYIASIDDQLVDYLPRFEGTAYDGVTVRHLLQMASGVSWNETYTDSGSDRRKMLEAQIGQQPGTILELMAGLPRAAEPGGRWNYSTGETHLVGALLKAATKKSVADYLSEKIWSAGMEADANWWLESPGGLEVAGSGLSATLRDFARFGLFLLDEGVVDGERVLPEGWVDAAGSRKTIGGEVVDYGYMLWPLHGNSYSAVGIFGQFIFVDPDKHMVVAMWSAQEKPLGSEGVDEYVFLEALSDYFD
jgi:CubicO group peptidase (beta-lactamase class C family)